MTPRRIQKSRPLGHLVGDEQSAAEAYIAERQAQFISPRNNALAPGRSAILANDKLRVKQVTYVDVKNMPIDVVADLWGVRFGTDWVEHEAVQGDELMAAIAQRLVNENLLERQVASNKMRTMYRLGTTGWRE